MPPLTVALDVAPLHGHRTGVGTAAAHLVAALERRDDVGVAPYLVSFRARPEPPERRLPLPAALAMRLWAHTDAPRVDRWLRGADVVHGTNYVAPPSRLPTVVSVYDCWFLGHPADATADVRRAADVLRRAAARGARIHVSSHATASVAGELLGTDRISVVHLGVPDPPAASPDRPTLPAHLADRPYLVTVGTIERRKDIPALVEAFGIAGARRPELGLVVVGRSGDDADRLDAALAALPAERRRRVHLAGAVDGATRDAFVAHAAALVYPSLDEGFGFPVLEAQLAGTPVVARRAGSIPEVGGAGVELVEPGSVDALADAIGRVIDDPGLAARLVADGHANTDRFSWARAASELVDVYRLAIEEQT